MRILAVALLVVVHATAQDTSKVIFIPAKKLLSDIRKAPEQRSNTSWIDYADTPQCLVTVVRRPAPGRAEVHKGTTDIVWYVIEGGGTLVTGGSLTEPIETEPNELRGHTAEVPSDLRGRGISGGEQRHVAKGDFVSIPAGIPHWLSKIDGEIVYLVVKVPPPK